MFWYKIHSIKGQSVIAICDKELLGKKIGEKIKISVSEDFYGEELIDDEETSEILKRSAIFNLLGKNIIKLALEKKFIMKENIMFIGDIPHAQYIR